jgi:ribonuclease P protein component
MQHARLGLIVGKKSVARASSRNRIKRVVRERFRQAQDRLPAVDLVVRIVAPVDRTQLHRYLDRLLLEIEGLEASPTGAEA